MPESSPRGADLFHHFRSADPRRLHFAAHSHHPWPDATLEAQRQYWLDSARWLDRKWETLIFAELVPAVQAQIAATLGLSRAQNIAFAGNTHELLLRLLSCLPPASHRVPRVLTSDSEFHSFERQTRRLEEDGLLRVSRVPAEPFDSFTARFAAAAAGDDFDLLFCSQVFFNSGYALDDLAAIAAAARRAETLVAIDGYHGFMALPTDLSALEDRIFYIAGGYKYAMAGEGCCFIHVPDGYAARPRDTGWFAEIGALGRESESAADRLPYAADGMRFWGATFDPSGLYRMRAAFDALQAAGLDVATRRERVQRLQGQFLDGLAQLGHGELDAARLLVADAARRGHFLTFRTPRAAELSAALLAREVVVDQRGDRLRFGFGIYQSEADVAHLLQRLATLD